VGLPLSPLCSPTPYFILIQYFVLFSYVKGHDVTGVHRGI
jgi:hypothetical protein